MDKIITIDGPSGVGKGTLGRKLAKALGWHYLDSGALYRLVALKALRAQVAATQVEALAELAKQLEVVFDCSAESVLLEGEDVSAAIRTEACGVMASKVSQFPQVRAALIARQRAFYQMPGLVTDGRDMGTVIFPKAGLKIFLTASSQIRAERRAKQLKEAGEHVNIGAILQEIERRDLRDQTRAVAPLVPAADAEVIATDALTVAEVFVRVASFAEKRFEGVGDLPAHGV